MAKSLLLHSLSLKDRILEPNKLPLNGQVWAYNKEHCSKEEFVGNCITMLSFLGMQNASIQWKEDILAFDTQWENRTYTIIISLQDDSLASEHYYFLGIWESPDEENTNNKDRFSASKPWEDEDLIKPEISYSVTVSSQPMQIPEMRKQLGSELFGQSIYGGDYYLCGTTYPGENYTGKFIIAPLESRFNHTKHDVRHALYSLRNLMALMGKSIAIHDRALEDHLFEELKESQRLLLLQEDGTETLPTAASDLEKLTERYGHTLLQACEILDIYNSNLKQIHSTKMMFDSIVTELAAEDSGAFRSLFHRMRLPFKHADSLLREHSDATQRIEKQVQILQQLMHSRMLARQSQLIESLINNKIEEL